MLRSCVSSILEQEIAPLEVIVVVNDNPELEVQLKEEYRGDDLVRIVTAAPRGVAIARSKGLESARGDVIVFADDDAKPEGGWLAHLLREMADPDVIMTAGAIDATWLTGRPRWFPDEFLWVVGCSYAGLPSKTGEVRNPFAASMALRKDVSRAVGAFSEALGRNGDDGMGCEETEYAIRAKKFFPQGRILYVPDARMEHFILPERTTWRYFVRRCWKEGVAKSALISLVGADPALNSERRYVRKVLVPGVLRRVWRPRQWSQLVAIVVGLAATSLGLIVDRIRHPRRSSDRTVAAPARA